MTDEAEPATDMRLFRFLFEVLVWDGSKNTGLTPQTLKQHLEDKKIPGIAEKRVPMPRTQKRKLNHGGPTHQTLREVSAYSFIKGLMTQHQGLAYKGNMSIFKVGPTLRPYFETAAELECLPSGKHNPPRTPPAIVWLVSLPASGKSYLQEDLCLYLQARGEHEQLITQSYRNLTCKFTLFTPSRVMLIGRQHHASRRARCISLGCESWPRSHYMCFHQFLADAMRDNSVKWLVVDMCNWPSESQRTELSRMQVVGVTWSVSHRERKERFIARHIRRHRTRRSSAEVAFHSSNKKWSKQVSQLKNWLSPITIAQNDARHLMRIIQNT